MVTFKRKAPPVAPGYRPSPLYRREQRRRRLARLRGWAVVLLLAAITVGVIWWRQPKTYREVGKYPAIEVMMVPCTTGFMIREHWRVFVLRDWTDGHAHWRVQAHKPDYTGWPASRNGEGFGYSVSMTGRAFATVGADGAGMRVQSWLDGRPRGEVRLPFSIPVKTLPSWPLNIQILDNGLVYAWVQTAKGCPAYLIDGSRIVARGRFPNDTLMAPDGKAVISWGSMGFHYFTIATAGNTLTLQKQYSAPGTYNGGGLPSLSYQYAFQLTCAVDGYLFVDNTTIYNAKGKAATLKDWIISTIAPGGRHAYLTKGEQSMVYCPQTGDQWSVRVKGNNQGGDTITSGRYLLACYTPEPSTVQTRFWGLLQRFPGLRSVSPADTPYALALYERPGRLRARMPKDVMNTYWGNNLWWFPSPDAHSVAFVADSFLAPGNCACFLYRW